MIKLSYEQQIAFNSLSIIVGNALYALTVVLDVYKRQSSGRPAGSCPWRCPRPCPGPQRQWRNRCLLYTSLTDPAPATTFTLLDGAGDLVVLLTHDLRAEDAAGGIQRVHSGDVYKRQVQ